MTTRRSLLGLALAPLVARGLGRGTTVASAFSRYDDAATELPVTRLTNPAYTSLLTAPEASAISRRGNTLLYASDESGRMQAYHLDLKKGGATQITDAEELHPGSLTLMPDERSICYVDGNRLLTGGFSAPPVPVMRFSDGYEAGRGLQVSSDGLYAAFVEKRGMQHRLRLSQLRTGMVTTLSEADEEIAAPVVRPKRASVLFRRGRGLYLANFDGKQTYRLRTAPEGEVRQALWSPDGRSMLYLFVPAASNKLIGIREFVPDTNEDRAVADTTQYASFGRNADASVFVGAGGSKASPYVLLLARAVKRELTLCEHRASDPAIVNPIFSPNSQQVFFGSDLHGKAAIYRMDVGKLVADTSQPESPRK